MKSRAWRYAAASVLGTSHERSGVPCQDAGACRTVIDGTGEIVLAAVVADGAGSAKYSEVGSQLACDSFFAELDCLCASGRPLAEVNEAFIQQWLLKLQREITIRADACGVQTRELACTFLAALIGSDWAAFFQIGDGAIVVLPEGESGSYHWIFWPDNGEFANSTFFVTDASVAEHLKFSYRQGVVEEAALFTDGLQALTLHYQTKTVFQPFFRPMFDYLNRTDERQLSQMDIALAGFLNSPVVNERTDDDKTLIIASRRGE